MFGWTYSLGSDCFDVHTDSRRPSVRAFPTSRWYHENIDTLSGAYNKSTELDFTKHSIHGQEIPLLSLLGRCCLRLHFGILLVVSEPLYSITRFYLLLSSFYCISIPNHKYPYRPVNAAIEPGKSKISGRSRQRLTQQDEWCRQALPVPQQASRDKQASQDEYGFPSLSYGSSKAAILYLVATKLSITHSFSQNPLTEYANSNIQKDAPPACPRPSHHPKHGATLVDASKEESWHGKLRHERVKHRYLVAANVRRQGCIERYSTGREASTHHEERCNGGSMDCMR